MKIIKKIEKHAHDIIGLKVNGNFYYMDNVMTHETGEFITLYAYQLDENNCYIVYRFDEEELERSEVELYRLQKI